MATQKSCKVFLTLNEGVCELFWINVTKDRSVILGTSYKGSQAVQLILEEGSTTPGHELISKSTGDNPKITFHYSGYYKVSAEIGKSAETIDRCTVLGESLADIKEPRRMAEIILPQTLLISERDRSDLDVVIDATSLPAGPLRCTLWCSDFANFEQWARSPSQIASTSTGEITKAFEDGERVWAFTVRTSAEDTIADESFYFHIPGKIQWGR